MNVGYREWGNSLYPEIQGWAVEYKIGIVAPWPKGLNKNGYQTTITDTNAMW